MMTLPEPASRRSNHPAPLWGRCVLAAALVGVSVLVYVFLLHPHVSWEHIRTNLDALQAAAQANPAASVLLFVALFVVITTLPIPIAGLLTMTAGALFGRWLGTGVVVLAATLSATLAFLATRYLFRAAVHDRFRVGMELIDRAVARDGAFYLFGLRLVPGFPFCVINMSLALTRMPVRTFVLITLVGSVPATFLFANAGQQLGRIESANEVLSTNVVVSLVLLGLAPLVFRKVLQLLSTLRGTRLPDNRDLLPRVEENSLGNPPAARSRSLDRT
jgi:uncharacterized membrane protein YdjX (TVP38/TMEM64 family)